MLRITTLGVLLLACSGASAHTVGECADARVLSGTGPILKRKILYPKGFEDCGEVYKSQQERIKQPPAPAVPTAQVPELSVGKPPPDE